MSEDFDTRLSEQVTTLSTKLVTEVAKSSQFEEALLQVRKENAALKAKAEQNEAVVKKYEDLQSQNQHIIQQHDILQKEHQKLQQEKNAAEEKNKQLEGEVEDLTASLFSEANEMVSNASREAYNFKLKNRKLFEELSEKDSIIGNLQDELKDLKELFIKMEDSTRNSASSRTNTPKTFGNNSERFTEDDDPMRPRASSVAAGAGGEPDEHMVSDEFSDDDMGFVLNQLIYGPRTRSIRLDLPQYQQDFKAFVYGIIRKDFVFDLASLKALKFFKRIWTVEIEPSLGGATPLLSGATFMNRWSKGKSFWSLIVEGKAVIEPVAGVNETFKLSYKGAKSGTAVPVALREACGVCGESKDDLLEHARLYTLKLYGPAVDSSFKSTVNETISIAGVNHDVVGSYPLCNYCLVKLRAICDFFAKLRSIHSNIYKLQPKVAVESVTPVNGFQFKRATMEFQGPVCSAEDEPTLIKLYLMLLVLRAKIFWAGIGFWDTLEDIESLNFDDIKSDTFKRFVSENVAYGSHDLEEVETGAAAVENGESEEKELRGMKSQEKVSQEKELRGMKSQEKVSQEMNSQEIKSQELKPQESKPQESKPQESKPQESKPQESKPQESKPQESKPQELNSSRALEHSHRLEKTSVQSNDQSAETKHETSPHQSQAENASTSSEGKVSDMVKKLSENSPTRKSKKSRAQKPKEEDPDKDVPEDPSEAVQSTTITRHKSKSKAFKKKINKDLEDTLSMLQESIE